MAIGSVINTSALTETFDGEFTNGFISSPDGSTGLWQTSMMNGNRTLSPNGEQEYYSDSSVGYNPFSVQNGALNINAEPASVAGANALGLPYDSGVITTESSFSQLYGYFEVDAKLPAGQGLWPAFWLLPESGAWPPELDVFEVLGNNPSTLYFSTHSGDQPSATTTLNTVNTSSSFNLYGVMWGPQTVDLYINNVEVASMPTPADMNVPMYMLANLAVGGSWPGSPDGTTHFPADMQIAYIKAFAYPGTTGGTVYDTLPSQNVGAAPVAPTITAPGAVAAASGVTTSLGGISVAANWPGGDFTVTVSDYSGLLKTTATNDVYTSGEDTTAVTLTGHLASINAALATLTYDGTPTGPDYLWVGATDPQGQQGTGSAVVNVGTSSASAPVVTTPATVNATAGASQALAGISVADSQPAGTVSVALSDTSGLLTTATQSGVTEQGEGTKALTLSGTLAAINADLATLTYQAAAAAGTDSLAVNATLNGVAGSGSVAITVNTGTANPTPVVTTPATATVAGGATLPLSGVSVADSAAGSLSVTASDSAGLLHTAAASGLTETGEGTTSLTLTGSLAAINADLAGLTYQASATTGTDWLWVSATAPGAAQALNHTVVTVTTAPVAPVVTVPATFSAAAGTSKALPGVSVADTQPGVSVTVGLSDTIGLLTTSSQSGVTEQGEGSTTLTLIGGLAAINAELATLTYHAGAASGADSLTVNATANGWQDPSSVAITVTAPAAPTPVVTTPASVILPAGASGAVPGVGVTDSAGGILTVMVSDSTGLLRTNAASGLTEQGEGTTALTLTGSLAAINADLISLTYRAASTTSTDWLWVSANAAGGPQGISHAVVTVAAQPASVVTGLHTGAGVTVLDGASSIQGALQVDGGHALLNTGTLVWNAGSIALGSGDPSAASQTGTLNNGAGATVTITGAGSVNSAGSTGSGTINNAGTLLKSTGTGATTVFAAVTNTGIVHVTAGALTFEQAASGNGTFEVNGGATLDFASAVGGGSTMRFLQPGGTLKVDAPGTFGPTILGFGAASMIDAGWLPPGSGSTLNFGAVGNNGTLTVSGGGHSALFDLTGPYAAGHFHMAADGHGGTDITYS